MQAKPKRKWPWVVLLIAVALAGTVLFVPIYTGVEGVGAFAQAVHVVRFHDAQQNSIEGVEVVVTDKRGRIAVGYPVSNFTGRGSITSDANGELRLFHVSDGVEFSVHGGTYFYLVRAQGNGAPSYTVNYYVGDSVILSHDYFGLDKELYATYRNLADWPRETHTIETVGEDGRPKKMTESFIVHRMAVGLSAIPKGSNVQK